MAKPPNKVSGSIESKLDGLARLFFVLGIIGFICFSVIACWSFRTYWVSFENDEAIDGLLFFVLGIVCAIQGVAASRILRGGAEVIRLLKRQNGLPFSGRISGS